MAAYTSVMCKNCANNINICLMDDDYVELPIKIYFKCDKCEKENSITYYELAFDINPINHEPSVIAKRIK